MAHPVQREYCLSVKEKFPEYFKNKKVLDVGSLDINGNNKHLFEGCDYTGLDVVPGKNVDIISIAHEYTSHILFDTIVSTSAFEHDIYLEKTLKNIIKLLSPSGLFFFTCASTGYGEHGTLKSNPQDSGSSRIPIWCDYYKNLKEEDIRSILDIDSIFIKYEFSYSETIHKDLRFWGVKKGLRDYNYIKETYESFCKEPSDINELLSVLRSYAEKFNHLTELGVRFGLSTSAFLMATPKKLISYDVGPCPEYLLDLSLTTDFIFNRKNVLNIEIEETDILFIDTRHCYDQLRKELKLHADKVKHLILIHDTTTFGIDGERINANDPPVVGLGLAIKEFLETSHGTWEVLEKLEYNNGLTVLVRK